MAAVDGSGSQSTVRSVERAIDLLEALERAGSPQRLADLARAVELSPSTALRMLAVLQRRGLVATHESGYVLGVGALGMGHGYLLGDPLVQQSRGVLASLASATRLTSSLYVRIGDERILAGRADGRDPLRYVLPLGRRLPLHVGAGKTILAFADAAEQQRIVEAIGPMRDAHGVDVAPAEFAADLAQIAERGFHISIAERDAGVAAISVPLRSPDGGVHAALSASGPAERNSWDELAALYPEMQRAAAALHH